MDKEVLELSGIIKGVNIKHEGLESSLKILNNRQESVEKSLKDLNGKYEHVVAYMAQFNQSLAVLSKEKGLEMGVPHLSASGSRMEETSRVDNAKGDFKSPHKLPKIDFPIFEGHNPKEWVRKANRYFEIHGIEENHRTMIIEMYLKG